jgi:hypothetical protein
MRKLSVVSCQLSVVCGWQLVARAETFDLIKESNGRRTTNDGQTSEGGIPWL